MEIHRRIVRALALLCERPSFTFLWLDIVKEVGQAVARGQGCQYRINPLSSTNYLATACIIETY